jgi:hypothetical protein
MSTIPSTRIQTVYDRAPRAAAAPTQPPVQLTLSPEVKGFFSDVWAGGKDQMAAHGNRLLHPVDTVRRGVGLLDKTPRQMFHLAFDGYLNPIKNGHPGQALGKLAANALVVGGAFLGGRALLGRVGSIGGGASVGVRSPLGVMFDSAARAVSGVVGTARNLVGGVASRIGDAVRWVVGGGAHVG